MPKGFVVNAHRIDPYKNYKFQLMWDGRVVAGVSKISALKRSTEVVKHREAGDNSTDRKSPGRTTYEAVTLERGLTHDPEFEKWANLVHPYSGDAAMDQPPRSEPPAPFVTERNCAPASTSWRTWPRTLACSAPLRGGMISAESVGRPVVMDSRRTVVKCRSARNGNAVIPLRISRKPAD